CCMTDGPSHSRSLRTRLRSRNLPELLRVRQSSCEILFELKLPSRPWQQSSCTAACPCATCSGNRYFPQQLAGVNSYCTLRVGVRCSELHHDNVQWVHSRGALGAAVVAEPNDVSRGDLAAWDY